MRRCTHCLYPDTKPDLFFDAEGICSACRNYESRPQVNWAARQEDLVKTLESAPRNGSGYDCIVPSSGGKDSHYIVLTLQALGARVLVVTASTDMLTPIGRHNIDNLARYATTIEVTPNRLIRAKLCRFGLELVGDPCWPEHASIFSIPIKMATNLGISLVFYGENPQHEYGGPPGAEQARAMTSRWRSEFGGFLGLRPSDFVGRDGITEADMADYTLREEDGWPNVYFLGQFLSWDSHKNTRKAAEAGMMVPADPPCEASWWSFENLDNALTGIHDHMMYRKYGFGRLAGQLCVDIRKGLISRDSALNFVRLWDGIFPSQYANVPFSDVLRWLGMTDEEFRAAIDAHTNWDLFARVDNNGRPILREFA